MLDVHVPNTYIDEQNYIIGALMRDFLGIEFRILIEEREDVLIEDDGTRNGRRLRIACILFQTHTNQWLTEDSLPRRPLDIWETMGTLHDVPLASSKLPLIYGCDVGQQGSAKYLIEDQDELRLGLDVFGTAFFMLTRYEEYVNPSRDQHNRFPATASLAYQEDFLDRPIIDEYLEILWWCMKRLWPELERKERTFRIVVSHDVDVPFAQAFSDLPQLIRNCGGDVLKRKSLALALQRVRAWPAIKRGDYRQDINYTFDRIMDISEQNGLQSAFYFKTACTDPVYDDTYSIDHPYVRQLIKDIHRRGHEIGFHPSYITYDDQGQTRREYERLRIVCEEEGVRQEHWGGRQHYLRWQVPITWRNWAEAGLDYDSTLSYADHAGFRCGVCHGFPVYDLEQRKTLDLVERPLVVMEGSVLGEQYMGLNGQVALDYLLHLKRLCQQFDGDFTLLWHNNSFGTPPMWKMYRSILQMI